VKGFDPGAWVKDMPPAMLNLTADLKLEGALFAAADTSGGTAAPATPASGETPGASTVAGEGQAGAPVAQPGVPAASSLPIDPDLVSRLQHLRAELTL